MYTIYQSENDIEVARYAARWGYASVIAYTRGVKTDAVDIVPYESAALDAYDVIDWISRQPWSDGQVGMYGGSYAGFTQWAVARLGHPALKTIVPQVSVSPGIGEPVENNVFVTQLAYNWPLTNVDYGQLPNTFFSALTIISAGRSGRRSSSGVTELILQQTSSWAIWRSSGSITF